MIRFIPVSGKIPFFRSYGLKNLIQIQAYSLKSEKRQHLIGSEHLSLAVAAVSQEESFDIAQGRVTSRYSLTPYFS